MIFFISTAMADAAAAAGSSGGFMSFLPMLFFIGVIYFLLIRPQQKRAKKHQALISSIKKGDKVVTNSGIIGTVIKVLNDQEILIEIADKVFVKFVKSTISTVMNPTTGPAEQQQPAQKQNPPSSDSESDQKVSNASATKSQGNEQKTEKNNANPINRRHYPKKKPANKTEEPKK